MSSEAIAQIKRELLVRHLEAWAPAALHRARRVIYVHGYADATADAAMRVLAEQSDLVRGRELTMLAIGDDLGEIGPRLSAIAGQSGAGAGLAVHTIPGATEKMLPVGLKAVGAQRVPLLGFLDAANAHEPPAPATVAALAAGKPAEVLLILPPGSGADSYRTGWPLFTQVELADSDEPGELLVFGATGGKSLESFKEALWAVDEFAGVRYRDPGDPDRHLIDISLTPHPGPLRRELLAYLERTGSRTVTELRTFALTETVYRAADATRVLHTLVDAGTVAREPSHGRLGGDVVISVQA
ncbi:hypothetical protein Aab01nite_31720 [Paractinoplanes abujensis]|uniref:Uncharacterized protein n=1 Tax=Paractinoplanes abujensis TaxID=882441 RepID=A0A7W7D0H6_9ACTN|nr:hypothetical protein [Actinoplanes abujensis]MBB4697936.1 hypothetical protein [Actinoplanes abujensis]GID19582.1 hypothetical protein Aab01nite_31720 [Actinoplanes abujensis]